MKRTIALASLVFLAAGAFAQGPPVEADDEPWGYVYAFRSLRAFPLTGEDNRVGRLPENQIALTSERVSRRHAVIRQTDEGIELVDLGSSNGSMVNGKKLRARAAVSLNPGDRIQFADELVLFHTTLEGLWNAELRLRLLSSMVEMNVNLPQDFRRKSLGREEVVPVESEAVLDLSAGTASLTHSVERDPSSGFLQGAAAFVGNVLLDDGVLELSLWSIEDAGSMTSRRASISRLKHTTLRITVEEDNNVVSHDLMSWFPQQHLSNLFDIFPEARDMSLRFATSLASQERPVALRDASASLAFRHMMSAEPEWRLLVLSAQAGGAWVETTVLKQRMKLTQVDRNELAGALEHVRARLDDAIALGADGERVDAARSAIERGESRLAALDAR